MRKTYFALDFGLLGAIHKKMNHILKTFPCCARGLYHVIENGGDDLAKMPIFKVENEIWFTMLCKNVPRWENTGAKIFIMKFLRAILMK